MILITIISCYQVFISPLLGSQCRYYPSCSKYAKLAIRNKPIYLAFYLIFKRIVSCNSLYNET